MGITDPWTTQDNVWWIGYALLSVTWDCKHQHSISLKKSFKTYRVFQELYIVFICLDLQMWGKQDYKIKRVYSHASSSVRLNLGTMVLWAKVSIHTIHTIHVLNRVSQCSEGQCSTKHIKIKIKIFHCSYFVLNHSK